MSEIISSSSSSPKKRLAFIFGDYTLSCVKSTAKSLCDILSTKLQGTDQFEVILGLGQEQLLTRQAAEDQIQSFCDRLSQNHKNNDTIGLFCFMGHGHLSATGNYK